MCPARPFHSDKHFFYAKPLIRILLQADMSWGVVVQKGYWIPKPEPQRSRRLSMCWFGWNGTKWLCLKGRADAGDPER